MLQIKIGLVDTTGAIDKNLMAAAAAALNVQVTRDVPQYWPTNAAVSYLPDPKLIPQGVWPAMLVASLPPSEGGFHLTKHNQPYAKIVASPSSDDWTVDASHEIIEMLVDPNGSRLQTAPAITIQNDKIVDGTGQFEYLVEACDPCEADACGYQVGGILVSDFITPHFYEPNVLPDSRYSFNGAIKSPREILPGGYISWVNPQTDEMQQLLYLSDTPEIRTLGSANGAALRIFVDRKTLHLVQSHEDKEKQTAGHKDRHAMRKGYAKAFEAAAKTRATRYK